MIFVSGLWLTGLARARSSMSSWLPLYPRGRGCLLNSIDVTISWSSLNLKLNLKLKLMVLTG